MSTKNKLKANINGKQIKIRLIELGMSQVDLARATGASKHYINHIISGYRSGYKYREAIEKVLGIKSE
ncbi:helix-turn-helix domain-containing protein [Ruminiclostridium cellobioparum]|uniref:Helix-turn-helix protein n=1 Tax=Ruminiclostridium cellobioparum subsp. termitidis CT1112 TaxID=1195236 RepID=S0FRT3_RUMCE|nr:helix-turn-helix transcriptional regulator [Ruminiclostridium cellobioparum]EMS73061.1 helix-turn-helix protein [Ruminiclostridium cellobioparum subsp. termitidis CT1112]